jgi:hypothetical protein
VVLLESARHSQLPVVDISIVVDVGVVGPGLLAWQARGWGTHPFVSLRAHREQCEERHKGNEADKTTRTSLLERGDEEKGGRSEGR